MKHILLLILIPFFGISTNCISTSSGDWENSSTWSCGHIPSCGDTVTISMGHTITITSQQNLSNCSLPIIINVDGVMKFQNGRKLKLPCGSKIYVKCIGYIIPGNGGGNSNEIEICSTGYWSSSDGSFSCGCFPPMNCSTPLPIELSLFKSVDCYPSKCIMWETQTERNNSHFELQRSTDGTFFKTIDTIESKADGGNSSTMLNYFVSDNDTDGLFYYRLKTFALDGTFETSGIISVDYKTIIQRGVILFPNPTIGGYTNWIINGCRTGSNLKIKIINTIGETIFSYDLITKQSPYRGVLSTSEMKNGIYFCSFNFDGYEFKLKLIID